MGGTATMDWYGVHTHLTGISERIYERARGGAGMTKRTYEFPPGICSDRGHPGVFVSEQDYDALAATCREQAARIAELEERLAGFMKALVRVTRVVSEKTELEAKLKPIELAATDSLVDELHSRYPHLAIAGLKEGNGDELIEIRYQFGNSRTVQGLLFGMALRIEQDLDSRRTPED
jgi:hypothetical protein